ncbi:hypothetical protein T492DRAFT_869486 [Pavlovales sp. CCMP2436]|nr:hypothetical protein T492DRAFT_869486 [Pavlovales sp. CCMP2436]
MMQIDDALASRLCDVTAADRVAGVGLGIAVVTSATFAAAFAFAFSSASFAATLAASFAATLAASCLALFATFLLRLLRARAAAADTDMMGDKAPRDQEPRNDAPRTPPPPPRAGEPSTPRTPLECLYGFTLDGEGGGEPAGLGGGGLRGAAAPVDTRRPYGGGDRSSAARQ